MAPGGVPDPWLTILAEVTGALPLVVTAVLLLFVYGTARLANRAIPGSEAVGLTPR